MIIQTESVEIVMGNIDNKIIQIEKRIIKRMSNLLIIWIGAVFLLFAFFFLLKEFLGWTNTAAFFSIGIIVFVIGLLLKVGEQDR